jgi:hypothetical protein
VVGDLWRTLVPYGAVRREVGVDTAEDHELLLLRLLAGERGYVFADDTLQADLQHELASPNPDLRILEVYAQARATLAAEAARRVLALAADDPALAPPPAPPKPAPRPAAPAARGSVPDVTAAVPPTRERPGCRFCGGALPDGRAVMYCPHCGQNLHERRCAGCSAPLDAGWKFCVACGRAAPTAG